MHFSREFALMSALACSHLIAPLASIARLLNPILKLQAATGDNHTRTCDQRPVCGNRLSTLAPHI